MKYIKFKPTKERRSNKIFKIIVWTSHVHKEKPTYDFTPSWSNRYAKQLQNCKNKYTVLFSKASSQNILSVCKLSLCFPSICPAIHEKSVHFPPKRKEPTDLHPPCLKTSVIFNNESPPSRITEGSRDETVFLIAQSGERIRHLATLHTALSAARTKGL